MSEHTLEIEPSGASRPPSTANPSRVQSARSKASDSSRRNEAGTLDSNSNLAASSGSRVPSSRARSARTNTSAASRPQSSRVPQPLPPILITEVHLSTDQLMNASANLEVDAASSSDLKPDSATVPSLSRQPTDVERPKSAKGVRIAQVVEQAMEARSAEKAQEGELKLSARKGTFVWNESDFDSDLDIESEKKVDHDTSGRAAYLESCDLLGVVPARYFMAHLLDKEMVMRHHGLGPEGAKAICKALRSNITIEKLDMSGNGMGEEGGTAMAKVLRDNEYITEIVLADNMMGTMGSYPVLNASASSSVLRVLNLCGNQLGDEAGVWIANLIDSNRTLLDLRLARNDLTENALADISAALAANDTLEILDLSWNKVHGSVSSRGKGVIQFAQALKENVRLKVLNLAWNGFGAEGGVALADALLVNDALVDLDLTGNRIESKAAMSLSRVFTSKNETLQILKLGFNPIPTTGAVALITQFNKSETTKVNTLHLTGVSVEFEFMRVLEELRRKRPNVRVTHGTPIRSGNTTEDLGKSGIDPDLKDRRAHPILLLKEHVLINDLSIIENLRKVDTEGKLAVTAQQFEEVLKSMGAHIAKGELNELKQRLDKLRNGTIYYGDILEMCAAQLANSGSQPQPGTGTPEAVNGNGNGNSSSIGSST